MAGFPDVPGYEIQAEIGRGGMAVVYSAIETDLGRHVAIKVVTAVAGDADGQLQRLENEARGLGALHHPHIVDLYRFGRTADGALFYVMPLLPRGSLEDWPKPVPEERVVALLDNLLDALGHAHAEGIVHRDIKPSNILFDRHDRPLLADFGAAFMRQRVTRLTTHGGAIGSSGYMSPEQARGQEVDARSDVYSTAVLAFELLTGKRPFEGPDDLAIALAQLEKPVPRLPPPLKHWQPFFDSALAVNPSRRFPDVATMRAAVRNLAKPSTRSAPSRGMAIALAVAVLVLGGVAVAMWKSRAPVEIVHAEVVAPKSIPFGSVPPPGPAADAGPAKPGEPANVPPTALGDRFTDPDSPELVLAKLAKGTRPALAVMAGAVDTALYQRYAHQRHRTPVACADSVTPAQGCLSLSMANDLATWLSKQTGKRYRVPTRTELETSVAQVEPIAHAYAWTSTCNEVRVARPRNAVQRGWAHVRNVFAKPKPQQYYVRCEGNFTLALDSKAGAAKVHKGATPQTVVVLVRDVRLH